MYFLKIHNAKEGRIRKKKQRIDDTKRKQLTR